LIYRNPRHVRRFVDNHLGQAKAAAHRIQLAIRERTVIERRNVIALAHDLLHPGSADHPSLVRPYWRNPVGGAVNRFTDGTTESDIS
jgi:hypothetical protein